MSEKNENIVKDFLEAFHEASVPDFKRMMRHFSGDAIYLPLVPDGSNFVGPDNIVKNLKTQFETYNDCRCEILAIGSGPNHVFTERIDHVTLLKDGRQVNSRVCAVFELNDESKIVSWREYWDTGNIVKQMGVTREQLDKDIA
jgi:limonene-1,2-epoxide hydrolase